MGLVTADFRDYAATECLEGVSIRTAGSGSGDISLMKGPSYDRALRNPEDVFNEAVANHLATKAHLFDALSLPEESP